MAKVKGITMDGVERVAGAFLGQAATGLESLFGGNPSLTAPAPVKNDLAALVVRGREGPSNG